MQSVMDSLCQHQKPDINNSARWANDLFMRYLTERPRNRSNFVWHHGAAGGQGQVTTTTKQKKLNQLQMTTRSRNDKSGSRELIRNQTNICVTPQSESPFSTIKGA